MTVAVKLYYSAIADLQTLVRTQQVSPVAIVDACLARISELNPRINAFALVLADEARKQARQAEAEIRDGRWRGPLHGIPVGIKDFYDTGVPTTAAFKPFEKRIPRRDAVSVAKLKDAGAIVVGKTNMHTLGMGTTGLESLFGPAENPWQAGYIPGGSSSGSAAAVAAGLCHATLDTDAIGSCRLPAACCGVTGFKGTYGLVSVEGILAGEQPPDETIRWLSHAGITARSVDDCAIVLSALSAAAPQLDAGTPGGDSPAAGRLRVGVVEGFAADREVAAAFENALALVRTFAGKVVSVAVPLQMPRFDARRIEEDRRTVADRVFRDVDVLILPTTAAPVLKVDEARTNAQALSPANTVFANYFGLPAVTVPCGFDARGLPLGLQIVGRPRGEGSVLALGRRYQAATDFSRRHPIP
jgi:aspartyl-tRNA(Asn)/glutamyl-tRNA(Gln) amidotransferase subunit A